MLFNARQIFGIYILRELAVRLIRGFTNTLFQLFIRNAFLFRPGLERQFHENGVFDGFIEPLNIPLLGIGAFRYMFFNKVLNQLMTEVLNHIRDIFVRHELHALFEDRFALIIHDIIIFEQVLPNIEIARLHALLGRLDRFGHKAIFNLLAFFPAKFRHHGLEFFAAENPQQVIFH